MGHLEITAHCLAIDVELVSDCLLRPALLVELLNDLISFLTALKYQSLLFLFAGRCRLGPGRWR